MKQGYSTLDKHLALLTEQGFTEQGLDTPYIPKTIREMITDGYNQCLQKSRRTNQDQSFSINFIGWFDHRLDYLHFRFRYRYNAERRQLRLIAIKVQLDHQKKFILIADHKSLASAQAIYEEMNYQRKAIAAKHLLQVHPSRILKKL